MLTIILTFPDHSKGFIVVPQGTTIEALRTKLEAQYGSDIALKITF